MRLDTWSSKIGLLAHLGSGWSTMWSPSKKLTDPNDPFIKNSDDMLNIIIGLTPQYKVNEKISLNFDISAVSHIRQNNNFDYSKKVKTPGISGYFFNWSLGATYYIGKKEKHADWTPTVYAPAPKEIDLSKYDAMIKELQDKTKDDDADGVADYLDVELNTPQGSYVNSKGEAIKNVDQNDESQNSDNRINEEKATVDKAIVDKAMSNIQFETNKADILKSSIKSLNDIVTLLKANPTYKLKISGHADSEGTDEQNMTLSVKRAKACASYLVSKGINESRLIVAGFGETKPLSANNTESGKALNRRVEFAIISE
jgi:OOP family OmpA-OmpF porin